MASSITTTLVADVGGTNTRVGLASGGALVRGSVRRFPNEAHTGLDDVLSAFVAEHSETVIDAAAVAVAGPVGDGTGELTNRAWAFDTEMLRTVTDAKHT
ncbi:MAG: glucokinase, partial [Boseongicola sp.]|nr:glucokinase [Boseongicola sp.]